MAAKAERSLVVLSANEEHCARIHSLCQQEGDVTVRWLSDPLELTHLLHTEEDTSPLALLSTGLILDLTLPSTPYPPSLTPSGLTIDRRATTITIESAHMEWSIVVLLALVRIGHTLPCLVISDYSHLRRALALVDTTVVGQIASDASATVWRTKLRVLLAHLATIQTHIEQVGSHHSPVNTRTNAIISLTPNLQLDLDHAVLCTAGEPVALTAREVALLTLLLRAPGHFLTSAYLADQLTAPGAPFPVDQHSVEQTVSALRRKMGESAQRNGILRNRRGLGYAIFPEKQAELAVELAHARFLSS